MTGRKHYENVGYYFPHPPEIKDKIFRCLHLLNRTPIPGMGVDEPKTSGDIGKSMCSVDVSVIGKTLSLVLSMKTGI